MTPVALIIFAVLMLLALPIAVSAGVASWVALGTSDNYPVMLMFTRIHFAFESFAFLAIPLFILTGNLMNASSIADRIFVFAQRLVGHIVGGLAHANVIASMIFAGMSGSAVADTGGLGQVEIKAMHKRGYDLDFAVAVTISSATIGAIIPPSIPMILYASLAEVSIGRLFLAGVVPGLLMAVALMVLISILSQKRGYPVSDSSSGGELWSAFKRAFLPLLTPAIIIGGMATGTFTVTESAAVAALYSLILATIVYREMTLQDLGKAIIASMETSAVMMFILAMIAPISWLMIFEHVAVGFADAVFAMTENPLIILAILNLVLLVLGMLLEGAAIMLLMIPIFAPLLNEIGIDLVHFGVIMVLNILIGGITPPIGMLLFVASQVSGLKLPRLMKAVPIFLVPLIVVLIVATFFPSIVLFIPNLIFG